MKICGIKFKDTGKTYYFKYEDLDLKLNLTVVVETEKGEQFGKVVELDVENLKGLDINQIKDVLRISTKKDYNQYLKNLKDAKEALDYAKKLIDENNLNMRLMDANFTLDRKQLSFNFIADERVDFREIVKNIASKFKTRIDLHQLGVRDKSKMAGGIGICGRELCCSKFLTSIDAITINMAKNQNISLNPNKINGCCGRLLCCLSYEDDVYSCLRKELPKMGQIVKTPNGSGKVVSLDILKKKVFVSIDGEKYEFEANDVK